MKPLEAVIFDMDGVLTETSSQHFKAWQQLALELGFQLGEEINGKLKGISRLESLEIVLIAGSMLNEFKEAEKLALADRKNAIYQSLIKEYTKDNLAEGALKLLTSIRENNIKIALASVSRNAEFLLKAMGIKGYFDAVADPEKVKHGKPAPDIYLLAAEMLGIKPDSCIGIEDARAGIESIKNAGMQPIGIGRHEDLPNCDIVVPNLKEIDINFLRKSMK